MSSKKLPDGPQASQPRLRVLAGPNGSGKSTIKRELRPQWIGVFINADEIERTLRESEGRLDLASLGITAAPERVLDSLETHIRESAFARKLGLHAVLGKMRVDGALMLQVPGPFNSYLASVLADAIRRELLDEGKTFTFETVMSSGDKVDFMREARERGYRVYLYFVATKDPAINVDRVKIRVKQGGHPVPEDKIRERYVRSIDLLTEAAGTANRAYVFDNSGDKHKLLVQVIDGESMEIEAGAMPRWFTETELWRSFNS
ncbi:zeta toxin family protein [Mitsuaria sp. 7]|uniref:zeta toxin family protein n=1 Tax=Mitsuaria sp. 7 TaxID=1658665 RepID=UPI001E336C9A|nr:zeta toxin family protein [Mitsuaria sp. 7]